MKRLIANFLLLVALAINCQASDQILDKIAHASVRVFASDGGLGSGSIYQKNAESIYILTNAHVVSRANSKVNIEFWYHGRLSKKIPGKVVAFRYQPQSDYDFAVVEVMAKDLGNYFESIEAIPLAPDQLKLDFTKIYSAGCPQGTWQTHWIGHGTEPIGTRQALKFVPMPANGRSGSAIYQVISPTEIYQTALITYRTIGTGKDGSHEKDGEGVAILVAHIIDADKKPHGTVVDRSLFEEIPVSNDHSANLETWYSLSYYDPYLSSTSSPGEIPKIWHNDGISIDQSSDFDIFPSLPRRLQPPNQQDQPPAPDGIFPSLPERRNDRPLPLEGPLVPPLKEKELDPGIIDKLSFRIDNLRQQLNGQDQKLEENNNLLRNFKKNQDENFDAQKGFLNNFADRFDRRMQNMEDQLLIRRDELQLKKDELDRALKENTEKIPSTILKWIVERPLIKAVVNWIRFLMPLAILVGIWWVGAVFLNLGPAWPIPIALAVWKTILYIGSVIGSWIKQYKASVVAKEQAKSQAATQDISALVKLIKEELAKDDK